MRGRRPKPIRLKVLTGNLGKRPLNVGELTPEPAIAGCPCQARPGGSPRMGRPGWRTCQLEAGHQPRSGGARGLLRSLRAMGRVDGGDPKIRDDDQVAVWPSGPTPDVAIADRQGEIVMRIASEFGFTPVSRRRISASDPEGPTLFDTLEPNETGRARNRESRHRDRRRHDARYFLVMLDGAPWLLALPSM